MEEFLKSIADLLPVIGSIILSDIILVIKLVKNTNSKKYVENILEVEKKVIEFICIAENFINFTGSDKKEWVKIKINQFCIVNKIKYDEEFVEQKIEENINLSKSVNFKNIEKGELL